MSSAIFTPSNRVKLTNVSVVRLKKAGKRFELACYKNRLADYRNFVATVVGSDAAAGGSSQGQTGGTPSTDRRKQQLQVPGTVTLDSVLQSRAVFVNVSKGELASKEDILKVFGKQATEDQILNTILQHGELQVSTKENDAATLNKLKEVASIVAEKCLNPNTRTPYPASVIERAITEMLGYAIQPSTASSGKSAKQQALEVITLLVKRKEFPIVRARLRVMLDAPIGFANEIEALISTVAQSEGFEREETIKQAGNMQVTLLIEPGILRKVSEQIASLTRGEGTVLTVSLKE